MMKPGLVIGGISAVLLCLQAPGGWQTAASRSQAPAVVPLQAPRPAAELNKLPLQFVPNGGQIDGPADFYVQGRDKTIYFAPEGLTFVLNAAPSKDPWVVKLDFAGANPAAVPESLEESGAIFSFFKGQPEDWRSGLPASSRIIYRDLWPGIDVVYYGTTDRLKSEFVVRPGADPSRIGLVYRGAESVNLTAQGRLAITTPAGGFEDDVPVAWQETGGAKTAIDAAYHLDQEVNGGEAGGGGLSYGFDIGAYDPSLPLVIDPAILVYCGYIGGTGWGEGKKIAVDGAGCAYVTGYTGAAENTFPVKVGPDLTYNGQPSDIFVAKVSADGSELVYCGYIGGMGIDEGYAIAVDGSGCAYVAGQTSSTNFPVTPGSSLQPTGGKDAVVAKVNAAGTELEYVGCIAGSDIEEAYGIAVDGAGCAYVVGWTWSNDMPTTIGPDLTYNGSQDAFIAKVDAAGSGLIYCGYIGGWANEEGFGVAVDAEGCAYVTGRAASPDFPFKNGPALSTKGWFEAFVVKVNAAGTDLDYGGYIGGRWDDVGNGIAVDSSGNAYVTGCTDSDDTTFLLKTGPDLSWNGGSSDAFVAKVRPDGTLVYCGYIGGEANERGNGIAVDGAGNAYIVGETDSPEATFPVREGPDLTWNGWTDAFVAKVNAFGTGLVYCGYIGGGENDRGRGIALDAPGSVYVTGETFSTEGTFPVLVGPDVTFPSPAYSDEGFAAKVSPFDIPAPAATSVSPSSCTAGDAALSVTVAGEDFEAGAAVMWDGRDLPTTFLNDRALSAEVGADDLAGAGIAAVTVRNPNGAVSNAMEFTVNNPVPTLTSLSPTQTRVRGSWFVLTLNGTRFAPGCLVRWDGQDRETTYISTTELRTNIFTEDIDTAGRFPLTVVNPAPGGGSSAAVGFSVVTVSVDASPPSVTVTAGSSAVYTVRVTPQFGAFNSAVSLSCTGLPRGCTYSFSPASVTPGANQATTALTVKTTAGKGSGSEAALAASARIPPAMGLFILASVVGWLCCFLGRIHAKSFRRRATAVTLIGVTVLIGGCSAGGGYPPRHDETPPGSFQFTVEAVSGSLTLTTPVTLVVK